jgi:hypothetical protein
MTREPSSMFYRLGKKAGWWLAANQHRLIQNAVGGVIRKLPGGSFLWRLFR